MQSRFGFTPFLLLGLVALGAAGAFGMKAGFFTGASSEATMETEKASPDGLPWHHNIDEAIEEAEQRVKPIFVDVYADWCPPCKMMDERTFPDPAVQKRLTKDFVLLKVDADTERSLAERFSNGSLPTFTIADSKGQPLASKMGFMDAEVLLEFLEDAT